VLLRVGQDCVREQGEGKESPLDKAVVGDTEQAPLQSVLISG
jgi:hypothetical protein